MLASPRMSESRSGPAALGEVLSRVAGRLRRGILVESLLLALFTFAFALSVGAGLLTAGATLPWGGGLAAVVLAAGLVLAGLRAVTELRQTTAAPTRVAAFLDRVAGRRGRTVTTRVLDATELERDRGRFGESAQLAGAAVDRAMADIRGEGLEAEVDRRLGQRARRVLTALMMATAVDAFFAVVNPEAFTAIARAISSPGGLQEALQPEVPEPRLGEFRIDYRYPAYSERPPRTLLSSTGDLYALPGTEVRLEVSARDRLRDAVIVLTRGSGVPPVDGEDGSDSTRAERVAAEVDGRRVRARFVLTHGGRYRVELVTEDGQRQAERRGHAIELELDRAPEVRLITPEESPLEVHADRRLPLRFSATDDFSLGKAQVAWRVLGTTREGKLPLTEETVGRARYRGRVRFDLRRLKPKPGDRIAYSVEVFDNDSISGPKVGASETRELHIYSERSHHAKAQAQEKEALDAVVHLLGDHLEGPYDRPPGALDPLLSQVDRDLDSARKAVVLLEQAAKAADKDPLGRENLDKAFAQAAAEVQRRIGRLARGVDRARRGRRAPEDTASDLKNGQIRMVGTLERQAVYLSDLLDEQRMLDAEALTRELREQQLALREALEDYRDAPTPEKRVAVARAIEDIRARLQEIMAELARLTKQIPPDFVNLDQALDRASNLDEVAKQIEEGDLDGAMEALDRMLGQTERMLSQLQAGRQELQSREYSEITEKARRLWSSLNDVKRRQKDLAERTEQIADQVRERSRDRLDDAEGFVREQKDRLRRARRALEPVRPERHMPDADEFEALERRLQDTEDALDSRDFGAASEMLEEAQRGLGALERDAERRGEQAERFGDVFGMGERARAAQDAYAKAEPPMDAVAKALEELVPNPQEMLTPEERRRMRRFEQEQRALGEEAEKVQQGLEELGEQLPLVGPEVRSALDDAKSAMGQSGQQLKRGNAPGAAGQERRAVEALERLAQQLEEMGSQSGGGQGSSGVPLPFGQPRGMERSSDRGGDGFDSQERVEIPRPEAYEAPSEFREDIIEAAKEKTVESYREAVRRYYEELVK